MWPFESRPTRASVEGHKKVKVCGQSFTIRRVGILDFPPDRLPAFFTDHKRPTVFPSDNPVIIRKHLEDMMSVLKAGVIDPPLNKPDSLFTAEDMFRDVELGTRLFLEIMFHSTHKFRGLSGFFLWLAKRLYISAIARQNMASDRLNSLLQTVNSAD